MYYRFCKIGCGLAVLVMILCIVHFSLLKGNMNKNITQKIRDDIVYFEEDEIVSDVTQVVESKDENISDVIQNMESTVVTKMATEPVILPTWPPMCPLMSVRSETEADPFKETACRPRIPTKESCVYTAEKFKAPDGIKTCQNQKRPSYQLCTISEEPNTPSFNVTCDLDVCDKGKPIILQKMNPQNGKLLDKKLSRTSRKEVEENVKSFLVDAQKQGSPFIFLNCEGEETISQMLYVLPKFEMKSSKDKEGKNKVNINIVLLDSISRAHFFRSLPKTVEYIRSKRTNTSYEAHTLEFEMFQAIHGHTHENEHAFFTGHLFPLKYSSDEIDKSPTNPGILFTHFKKAGYQTMYMEDMCWKSLWGLPHSFQTGSWKSFQEKINNAGMDTTGLTFTSCKILNGYGSTVQFYANKHHQLCFNGKHHHTYHLDYLKHYFNNIERTPGTKPLFSMSALNVAHDDVGIRVQTLDEHLVQFLESMSKLKNTLTIVYADHGNTYTYYQVKMLEGRLEMYHPMMLAIIPKQLGQNLGTKAISNIITNQQRLFTLLDVRESLIELSNYGEQSKFPPVGIFGEISKSRECKDLVLTKASICLCEGSFLPVGKSTLAEAIVEFGIGELNNRIQKVLNKNWERTGIPKNALLFGSCQRLKYDKFENMRKRKMSDGSLLHSVDIKVESTGLLKQDEVFTINVQSSGKPGSRLFKRELISFERVSTFGPYKECADDNVDLKLCICNKDDKKPNFNNSAIRFDEKNTELEQTHPIYTIIPSKSKASQINKCLILIYRFYSNEDAGEVKVYEMANICSKTALNARISLSDSTNVLSSAKLPKTFVFPPKSIYFITTLQATSNGKASLSLRVRINRTTKQVQF